MSSKQEKTKTPIDHKCRHLRLVRDDDFVAKADTAAKPSTLARPLIGFLNQLADAIDQQIDTIQRP